MRDEAHRFGITFHRSKRDKGTLKSELQDIPGIGTTTLEKLLTKFKSVKKIRESSDEELASVLNKNQLIALREYFK